MTMDLQQLLDERAIVRALSYFARILDNKEWGRLSDVFMDEVSFDYGSGEQHRGIDALHGTMAGFLDRCGPTQHLIGSILVDVDGDSARSSAYVQARHQERDDPTGAIYDTNGEYRDHWVRQDGIWKIDSRQVVWATLSGDPSVIGIESAG